MTLENTFYESKPYVIAILGLYSVSLHNQSFANTCGALLLIATFLIASSRYHHRYVNGAKTPRRIKSKSKKNRITNETSERIIRIK